MYSVVVNIRCWRISHLIDLVIPSADLNSLEKQVQNRISKMELFAKIASGFQRFPTFAKIPIVDVRLGSDYASEMLVYCILSLCYILCSAPFVSIKRHEAVSRRYYVRKVFLKVSQNSEKSTCARVFF